MLYGDIETEPIDKDWLFGFRDEINDQDWLCIQPYEDEWYVVKSLIDEAAEGKGDMYGLEKLCKEFPYVPMAVDKKTGITVGVYPTDYNPRLTNIFHVILNIKKKYGMKNEQYQNSYNNNNGKAYNGGFNQNPPQTNYMKVDCMGTNSTNLNNANPNNQQLEQGDIAVLRQAYHEFDEPPKYEDTNLSVSLVKTQQEEKEEGYGVKVGTINVSLNTEPTDRNWHPNKNQYGSFNSPFAQGINPYQYNPNTSNNSFGGSSYLSGYRGTVGPNVAPMHFSCFADGYAVRDAQIKKNQEEAMRINQMVNQNNPTRLETGYTDFSNPESVRNLQNPYGYLNGYSNPNIRGYQPINPPPVNNGYTNYVQTPQYSYGPSMQYSNGIYPSYSYPAPYYNDDFMIATDEEVASGNGVRPFVTKGEYNPPIKEVDHVSYVDRVENPQFKVTVVKVRTDGTVVDNKGNEVDSNDHKEEVKVEEPNKGEVKYDVYPSISKSSIPNCLAKYSKNNQQCGFKVFPDLRNEVENLCEDIEPYDGALSTILFISLDDQLTYEEFDIFKKYCKNKLKWYQDQEKEHPELDYRLDYRYRPDPKVFNIAGRKIIDNRAKHEDIQKKVYDKDGNRIYQFDRGHGITDEEMRVFIDRAMIERDDLIVKGKVKRIMDNASSYIEEEENYNPYDPISVRIHEVKVQQRQAREQYNFYKKAYRNLMSETQFDNWWFGGSTNVPNRQLTPLQQRLNYVYRMTEMNMNMLMTQLIPIDYEQVRKNFINAEYKAYREFDQGCMEGVSSLKEYFDRLGYLMCRVDEMDRRQQVIDRMNNTTNRGSQPAFCRMIDERPIMRFAGRLPEGIQPSPYNIQQNYVKFTNQQEYGNKRDGFLKYCFTSEGSKQLKPISN